MKVKFDYSKLLLSNVVEIAQNLDEYMFDSEPVQPIFDIPFEPWEYAEKLFMQCSLAKATVRMSTTLNS
jgi:hypothetical protein